MPSQRAPQRSSAAVPYAEKPSGFGSGLVTFAGVLMIISGLWGAAQGLVAIVNDKFYVVGAKYVFEFDVTAWGWIHVLLGIGVAVVGYFVIERAPWARVIAIILATVSAIANFMWLPHYPVWAIVIIALDILIIWALTMYGDVKA